MSIDWSTVMKTVNTNGLTDGQTFAALFNAAMPPVRRGAMRMLDAPLVMSESEGEEVVGFAKMTRETSISNYDIDIYAGRSMKLNFTGNGMLDVTAYSIDNGEDTAQRAIEHLRSTGEVMITPSGSARDWLERSVEEALRRYDDGDRMGCFACFYVRMGQHPRTKFMIDMKPALGMIYDSIYEGRAEAKKAMLAWML